MNPSLFFTASPGDVNPFAFSFYGLDTGSLLEPVTDFSLRLQVNGMRFIEKQVFQNYTAIFFQIAPGTNPKRSYGQKQV